MDESVEVEAEVPVEQIGLPSTLSPQMLSKMREIIDALSHEDAIKIFIYAKDGITNSTMAIKKLGLTQKRYYTRLKQLLEAGLLEKREDGYWHTVLGNILYQMGKGFKTLIEQKDRLELANRLRKTKTLTLEEKKRLMSLITPSQAEGISSLADLINPVRMDDNYEELVKAMISMIDQAEESMCLVSKYRDVRVIEAMSRALQRGINIRILGEEQGIAERLNMLRALLSPKIVSVFLKVAKELSSLIRKTHVSYSFMVIDEKWAVVEVPHPSKETFYLGFIFQNAAVCKKLTTIFNEMWEKAGKILKSNSIDSENQG